MLEINVTQVQGRIPVTVIQLKGTFDSEGAQVFDARSQEVLDASAKDVLVDMSGVTFMASVGIRSLHRLFYALHPEGSEEYQRILNEGVRQGTYQAPHMKLLSPSAKVMDTLKMMGVDMYMSILSGSQAAAVQTF